MSTFEPGKLRTKIAQDLTAIAEMFVKLRAEAVNRAGDPDIPGGAAMVMLGPGADVEAWGYVQISAMLGRLHLDDIETAAVIVDDIEPPLSFLASWADIVRDERGQGVSTRRARIDHEIRYLRSSLDWMLSSNDDGEPWFIQVEDFANELQKVRRTMENVLRDGEQVDRGVPCMNCGRVLVKAWGEDEDADRWHCHGCGQWSTVEQYKLAVKAAHRAEADRLNATDMLEQYRIRPGSLTSWASTGKVRKRGKDQSGRVLYDVTDAVAQRDKDTPETQAC